jgi:predicted nuclease of predicted toxin-antitoxin system
MTATSSSFRLLFDQNVPAPLAKLLPEHEITTAHHLGWGELSNGKLLNAAQSAGFEVMMTVDKNLRYQQNLEDRQIGILVLPTQKIGVLKGILSELKAAIDLLAAGGYLELKIQQVTKLRRSPPET